MKFHAVLFDLDGTLLDTIEDLTDSMNAALGEMGLPPRTVQECKFLVGDGREAYARRALPDGHRDRPTVARCVELMTAHYSHNWANKTKPYEGAEDLLSELGKAGVKLAVLSNKYDQTVRDAVGRYFGSRFDVVRGERDGVPHKPDPAAALEIASELGVPPARFLYLGDTNTDMRTAVAAGMYPVGVLWGFRPAEELLASGARTLIARPADLLALL